MKRPIAYVSILLFIVPLTIGGAFAEILASASVGGPRANVSMGSSSAGFQADLTLDSGFFAPGADVSIEFGSSVDHSGLPDSSSQYFNASDSPLVNSILSTRNNPDQKGYQDSSFAGGQVIHGPGGAVQGNQQSYSTTGANWPALVPPVAKQTDPRSKVAIDAVMAATGAGNPLVGRNLLNGNVAGTAVAVGMQQAIARAQMPESIMPIAKEMQNQQNQVGADNFANITRNQAACAIDFVRGYLTNFTSDGGNKWNQLRNELFVPIALLLLLPGAVLAQAKAIVAQGFGIFGHVNPFDGIIRSILAIFLIPATSLVVNYGIDVSNAINASIRDQYRNVFGSDMYRDAMAAQIRAFPVRQPSENLNYVPGTAGNMSTPLSGSTTPFARMEGRSLSIKLEDPVAGVSEVSPDRANEVVPYFVNAQRMAYNGANAALSTTWTILCAFQMAYLYYLWFVGPIVAALWVWPMAQLRQALPNWVDGVVTICFWSLFWNTSVLLMACFRGIDDTGTVMMTALNFLSTASVKFAFDFSSLVKAAGAEAGKMASKAAQGSPKAGSKAGGGAGGAGGSSTAGAAGGGQSSSVPSAGARGVGDSAGRIGSRGAAPGGTTAGMPAFASSSRTQDARAFNGGAQSSDPPGSAGAGQTAESSARTFAAANPEMNSSPLTPTAVSQEAVWQSTWGDTMMPSISPANSWSYASADPVQSRNATFDATPVADAKAHMPGTHFALSGVDSPSPEQVDNSSVARLQPTGGPCPSNSANALGLEDFAPSPVIQGPPPVSATPIGFSSTDATAGLSEYEQIQASRAAYRAWQNNVPPASTPENTLIDLAPGVTWSTQQSGPPPTSLTSWSDILPGGLQILPEAKAPLDWSGNQPLNLSAITASDGPALPAVSGNTPLTGFDIINAHFGNGDEFAQSSGTTVGEMGKQPLILNNNHQETVGARLASPATCFDGTTPAGVEDSNGLPPAHTTVSVNSADLTSSVIPLHGTVPITRPEQPDPVILAQNNALIENPIDEAASTIVRGEQKRMSMLSYVLGRANSPSISPAPPFTAQAYVEL